MKRSTFVAAGLALLGAAAVNAQAPAGEPTEPEIEQAYRSRIAGGVLFRRETWRIKSVRGWALKFKRLHEERRPELVTRRYQAIARKDATCAEYSITEVIALTQVHTSMLRHQITVRRLGPGRCR